MQDAAHLPLERAVDKLVLLNARLAPERLGYDGGGIVIAVAGEILIV